MVWDRWFVGCEGVVSLLVWLDPVTGWGGEMCLYDPRLSDSGSLPYCLPLRLKGHKPKKLHKLVWLMRSFSFNTHEGA